MYDTILYPDFKKLKDYSLNITDADIINIEQAGGVPINLDYMDEERFLHVSEGFKMLCQSYNLQDHYTELLYLILKKNEQIRVRYDAYWQNYNDDLTSVEVAKFLLAFKESKPSHYFFSTLTDAKIRALTEDVLDLTPEGLQVLKEEVSRRNLPLARFIDNAFNDQAEIDKLIEQKCTMIRDQPCPICNGDEYLINAIWLTTVTSFITATHRKKTFHLACGKCLMEIKHMVKEKTSLLGWWGIFGISATLTAIRENDEVEKEVQTGKSTQALRDYAAMILQQEFKSTMNEINIEVQNNKER